MFLSIKWAIAFCIITCNPINRVIAAEAIPAHLIPNADRFFKEVRQTGTARDQRCESSTVSTNEVGSCSEIVESACSKLWDSAHNGNLQNDMGIIQLGKTQKSDLSAIQRIDLEAWLESEEALPEDLRERISGTLADLRQVLQEESRSKLWYQQLGLVTTRLQLMINETVQRRIINAVPEIQRTPANELPGEQQKKIQEIGYEFQNEILRAKYQKHPNWKRVEKVFKQVKEDLQKTIKDLNISDEWKQMMFAKVKSVTLSLPYPDPRIMMVVPNCQSTEKNAFYTPRFNVITVCAGLFNGLQSEANLFAVIAHELSHSIDPDTIAYDQFEQSEVGQVVAKIYASRMMPLDCEEWKNIREKILSVSKTFVESPHPYQKLVDCLLPQSRDLKPLDSATMHNLTKRYANLLVDKYATQKYFTLLAQPQIPKNGEMVENPNYLRPSQAVATPAGLISVVPEIFVQSLSCQKGVQDGVEVPYESATGKLRSGMFEKAIMDAREVQQVVFEAIFSKCGRECAALVGEGLSRNGGENFADWMAFQALPSYLNRENSKIKRKEIIRMITANFCLNKPVQWEELGDFSEIEKKFSFETHPDSRIRQISIITPAVAKIVGCRIDEEMRRGFGECGI